MKKGEKISNIPYTKTFVCGIISMLRMNRLPERGSL